ncbi:MAG: hypothetical protein ACK57C_05235 [Bacteroidota bacterium]
MGSSIHAVLLAKSELILFCSAHAIPANGTKQQITARIHHYLRDGKLFVEKKPRERAKKLPRFNWNRDTINVQTIITDNYVNILR